MSIGPDEPIPSQFLPCVIPQVTRSFRGPLYSPFVRASPDLKEQRITETQCLAFIDGLNERFIPHTIFFAFTIGSIPAAVYLLMLFPIARYTLLGLRLSTIPASVATALIRTKIYLHAANAESFHPAGLHVSIMPTKKMLKEVGYPYGKLQLSLLDTSEEEPASGTGATADVKAIGDFFDNLPETELRHGTLLRRMNALDGYATPLNFDIPPFRPPSGYFRKMAASNARGKSERQEAALAKRTGRMNKKYREKMIKVEMIRSTFDNEIAALRATIPDTMAEEEGACRARARIQQAEAVRDQQIAEELRKAERVRAKHVKKEEKIANQLWWIVIRERRVEVDQEEADENLEDLEELGLSKERLGVIGRL